MQDIFWSLFEKSGNIDAFMAYEEFKNYNKGSSENKKEKITYPKGKLK